MSVTSDCQFVKISSATMLVGLCMFLDDQVVLPLVEKYFRAHKAYFITNPNMLQTSGTATIKEKEMTAR